MYFPMTDTINVIIPAYEFLILNTVGNILELSFINYIILIITILILQFSKTMFFKYCRYIQNFFKKVDQKNNFLTLIPYSIYINDKYYIYPPPMILIYL